VEATDWSWGALIADLDNDGLKDIFVSNGMFKDVADQDIVQFLDTSTNRKNVKQLIDLLRQLADIAPEEDLRRAARSASDRVFRGVVAASSIISAGEDEVEDDPQGVPAPSRAGSR